MDRPPSAGRSPGDSIVFVHGIGSNANSFRLLREELPDHLHTIAWNAPGYLTAAPVADPWPLAEDYARVLCQFLDDLGCGSVHLVGHSLGTLIAASFARLFPERVTRLVLAAAACGYKVPKGAPLPAKVALRIEDLSRLGPKAFARARAGNLVHAPERHPDVVAHVETTMSQVNPSGYAQAVRLLASGDLCAEMQDVPIQPGFIIGSQDTVTPVEQTNAAARAWADAHGRRPQVIKIEDAGHAVYLQKPTEFCQALLDLLQDPESRALERTQSHERG